MSMTINSNLFLNGCESNALVEYVPASNLQGEVVWIDLRISESIDFELTIPF
jgi:hypothetical protein